MINTKHIFQIVFLLVFGVLKAQQKALKIDTSFLSHKEKRIISKINDVESDSLKSKLFDEFILQKNKEGYLSVKTDTAYSLNIIRIIKGNKYMLKSLKLVNGLDEYNYQLTKHFKKYNNKELSQFKINKIVFSVLDKYQNNGYPFAVVMMDSSVFIDNYVNLIFHIKKGEYIKYDSIIVKGNGRINKNYLSNYTGIKKDKFYSEADVKQLTNRLNEIVFIKSLRKPDVVFIKDKAKIIYYLDNKSANQFDGFAGILPDDKTGKINITGQAQIKLVNSFGQGEQLDINWRKLQPLTQDLKVSIAYPFIGGSPFGVDNVFKLYKRDTTFIDLTNNAGLNYFVNQWNSIKIVLNTRKSSLLNPKDFKNATVLPEFADLNSTMYGMGFKSEKLDYRINPRKGFRALATASAGSKKILKNPELNELLYQNLILNTVQYAGNFSFDLFVPIFRKSTLNFGTEGGGIIGDNIFKNELYRLGGLVSWRGFDEESINASSYITGTLEYRFLFEQNSSLYFFTDMGWYENNSLDKYVTDTPLGFGTGISFQTKAGIFTINYALGKQFNNPIILRSAKIHFGLVNYF